MERTLAIVKPDAVDQPWKISVYNPSEDSEAPQEVEEELRSDKTDEVIARLHAAGFRIANRRRLTMSKDMAKEFYREHASRGFYDEMTDFMSSGPVVVMCLERENAIKEWRNLLGNTDSAVALEEAESKNPLDMGKWTIRAALGTDKQRNCCHGSDSSYSAMREIDFFFGEAETPRLERTLAVLKGSAVGKEAEIVAEIEKNDMIVLGRQEKKLSDGEARNLYSSISGEAYFDEFIKYISSGAVVALCLEGIDAVKKWRMMIGPENAETAQSFPETLRARFGKASSGHASIINNGFDGSNDVDSAISEIQILFPKPFASEKTLAMIKPCCAGTHYEEIMSEIERNGFSVIAQSRFELNKARAEAFYAEHKEKGFFGELTDFMSSGPIYALVLSKASAIKSWRQLIGPTNSQKAKDEKPNSLRGRFGTDGTKNACHGSDAVSSATREIAFFFPQVTRPLLTGDEARNYIMTKKSVREPQDQDETFNQVLVRGLTALCREKPAGLDAVRWLGNYLLENNPNSPKVE